MPALPDGDPAPADGTLPASVLEGVSGRAFGVYLHVPFCVRRCGYCDFNTYTPGELLVDGAPSATAQSYLTAAKAEISFAATALAKSGVPRRPVSTVFVGGGTPTMLPSADLVDLLDRVRCAWGLAPDAEVTTEANPDSVTPESLAALAAGGFTRVSFGMQSAVPHVLATLDRTHDPARVPTAVRWARDAGLAVSLDLIYGTPGESLGDWRTSLKAAVACEPDHLSAYALTVEPGTALAAKVRRGDLPAPEPDDEAVKYEIADEVLGTAGFEWYEISNWALGSDLSDSRARWCRHNVGYWRGDDWWGFGPGAHSHMGGVRWWNVKHPRAYADRLAQAVSPAKGREVLAESSRALEEVLLRVRLREGWDWSVDDPAMAARVQTLRADGLLLRDHPLVLNRRGRLLADHAVRVLTG